MRQTLLVMLLVLLVSCSGCQKLGDMGMAFIDAVANPGTIGQSRSIIPDAYGPGIHMDQYGRPVKLYTPNGVPGERLNIRPNAYGPGVHMDQYGRPVYAVPAF